VHIRNILPSPLIYFVEEVLSKFGSSSTANSWTVANTKKKVTAVHPENHVKYITALCGTHVKRYRYHCTGLDNP
jgi:hypothetical protein